MELLLSHKKRNPDICKKMDGTGDYCTKHRKPSTEKTNSVFSCNMYMWHPQIPIYNRKVYVVFTLQYENVWMP